MAGVTQEGHHRIRTLEGGGMASSEKSLRKRITELEELLADIRDQIDAVLGDEDEVDEDDYAEEEDVEEEEEDEEEE